MKSWIEISEQRLAANYRAAHSILTREAGPDAALLAVVKANAYGHSAAVCAPVLARAGAPWLGVTDATEGATVRAVMAADGIPLPLQPQILVMCGHLPEEAPQIVRHALTPVVWNREQLQALLAVGEGKSLPIHLEIDTGMSRQGIAPGGQLASLLRWLVAEPRLHLDGLMTHFASSEVAGSEQTTRQRERFEQAIQLVAASGLRPRWVHAGNTSALDNGADGGTLRWLRAQADRLGAQTMAREGLGLYGYSLPLAGLAASDGPESQRLHPLLLPVMTWKTRVLALSDLAPGDRVGYNGTFVAQRPMRLALLPVGYADGLRRELSCSTQGSTWNAGGWVMVGDRRARIVGRISMNLTTVDVTGLDRIAPGDEVVVLGDGITAEDHAALAHTISYEILCGLRAPIVPV